MVDKNRLPEPTPIQDGIIKKYVYDLIRVIRLNSSDLNTRIDNVLQEGDIVVSDTTKGLVLTSPDGTKWRVTVDNTGTLITTSL